MWPIYLIDRQDRFYHTRNAIRRGRSIFEATQRVLEKQSPFREIKLKYTSFLSSMVEFDSCVIGGDKFSRLVVPKT